MNAVAADAARRLDLLRGQQGLDKDVNAMAAAFLLEIAQKITAVTGPAGEDGEDVRSLCAAAPAIELESPRTVAGMNYLVALNILTPERRDAILDPNL